MSNIPGRFLTYVWRLSCWILQSRFSTLLHVRAICRRSKQATGLTLNSRDSWPPAVREPKVPLNTWLGTHPGRRHTTELVPPPLEHLRLTPRHAAPFSSSNLFRFGNTLQQQVLFVVLPGFYINWTNWCPHFWSAFASVFDYTFFASFGCLPRQFLCNTIYSRPLMSLPTAFTSHKLLSPSFSSIFGVLLQLLPLIPL